MVIDGSFLLGVAAVLTSVATLWRAVKGGGRCNDGMEQNSLRSQRQESKNKGKYREL